MTGLKDFLNGKALDYTRGKEKWSATFKRDDGIELKCGRKREKANVPDELGATRFYHNTTRGLK